MPSNRKTSALFAYYTSLLSLCLSTVNDRNVNFPRCSKNKLNAKLIPSDLKCSRAFLFGSNPNTAGVVFQLSNPSPLVLILSPLMKGSVFLEKLLFYNGIIQLLPSQPAPLENLDLFVPELLHKLLGHINRVLLMAAGAIENQKLIARKI